MHGSIERRTFSKILVAIDESNTSAADRAVNYAVNIAQDYDARLVILHVIRADVKLHGLSPPSHIIEMTKEEEALFAKIIERAHEESSDNEHALRIRTDIIASIRIGVSYAKDKGIDLIITGTRGRSKLKSVLAGSIASDVIRYAHCPVMIVK
jgi:nucleotide-binding universal stress UspA family protein